MTPKFLFSVRGARPGKNVQLTEAEIRGLCLKSREIFLSQPILLELEAPLKICGEYFYFLKPHPQWPTKLFTMALNALLEAVGLTLIGYCLHYCAKKA